MNDCTLLLESVHSRLHVWAYSELSAAPEAFNDPQVVEGEGSEHDLCRVGIACLHINQKVCRTLQ